MTIDIVKRTRRRSVARPEGAMAADTKRRMVGGAVRLLARKGLESTSFSEVLALTGAPRGSLYHHFPGGKDELVVAAVDAAGAALVDALETRLAANAGAVAVTTRFLDVWRQLLVASGFASGCAVLAVTVSGGSGGAPIEHAAAAFARWRDELGARLARGGLAPRRAAAFATLLIASVEGAVVLARAEQSLAPFEDVARQLVGEARRLAGEGRRSRAGPASG